MAAFSVVSRRADILAPPLYDVSQEQRVEERTLQIPSLAWALTTQLVCVLHQEELEWTAGDGTLSSKKVEQMARWLNTRLLFGCSALEHIQAATSAKYDRSLDSFEAFDRSELLQTTLAMEESEDTEDRSRAEDISSEFDMDLGTEERAAGVLSETRTDKKIVEDTNDLFQGFGRPLEVVKANMNPIQLPEKTVSQSSMSREPPNKAFDSDTRIQSSETGKDEEDRIKKDSCNQVDEEPTNQTATADDMGLNTAAEIMPVNAASQNLDVFEEIEQPTTEMKSFEDAAINISTTINILPSHDPREDESVTVEEVERETMLTLETEATHASVDSIVEQDETLWQPKDGPNVGESEEMDVAPASNNRVASESIENKDGTNSARVREMELNHNGDEGPVKVSKLLDRRIRQVAATISHSFQASGFNPPLFTRNGHFQTIFSFVARNKNPVLTEFRWDERTRMTTPDGDFFNVDWKFSDCDANVGRPSDDVPLVLVCHGLQANSNSPLAKDMARAYNHVGMDVACINFRGCCGEINNGPFGYHLSFTDDLKLMVEHIASTRPGTTIFLSGFSLGANVVTKLLAEMGTEALLKYNICGAAVNALPFDFLKVGPNFSDKGLTKLLYGNGLLESLKDRVLQNFDDQDYSFTKEDVLNCKTLREFDDLAVCDVYDFDGYKDYHRKSSTIDVLDKVAVPQLVVQALDDPFFKGNTNPPNNAGQPMRIHYTEHGGHCGYVSVGAGDNRKEASWMPSEMARFLKHVNDQRSIQHDTYKLDQLRIKKEVPSEPMDASTPQLLVPNRERAAKISNSFQTRDFVPAAYARNSHVQTVMGALLRKDTVYASPDLSTFLSQFSKVKDDFQWDKRQRLETPDDDYFDVDWKVSSMDFESKDVPLVIICHGLQANSDSPLVKDMTEAFLNVGMGVACINCRGCSGEVSRTPRSYHLGFTEDLEQLVSFVSSKYPGKRIYLSGFSLGANVVTKFLGDLGDDAFKYNIGGAAVNALPFEVAKSTANLNEPGLTKSLYADRILDSMYVRIEDMLDEGVEFPFPREKVRECKTIMDMENLVVAPFFGFDDAWDYYEKTGTLKLVGKVSVPELVIQSRDDPFLLGQSDLISKPEWPLRLQYTEYGGHCGHVFHSTECGYETSWMPTELARFLAHVELSLRSTDAKIEEGVAAFELNPAFEKSQKIGSK